MKKMLSDEAKLFILFLSMPIGVVNWIVAGVELRNAPLHNQLISIAIVAITSWIFASTFKRKGGDK